MVSLRSGYDVDRPTIASSSRVFQTDLPHLGWHRPAGEDLGEVLSRSQMAPLFCRHSTGEIAAKICEAKDQSDGVFIRGLLTVHIAFLRTTDTADKACFVQNGDDLLYRYLSEIPGASPHPSGGSVFLYNL